MFFVLFGLARIITPLCVDRTLYMFLRAYAVSYFTKVLLMLLIGEVCYCCCRKNLDSAFQDIFLIFSRLAEF